MCNILEFPATRLDQLMDSCARGEITFDEVCARFPRIRELSLRSLVTIAEMAIAQEEGSL